MIVNLIDKVCLITERIYKKWNATVNRVRIHNLSLKASLANNVTIHPGFEIGHPENLIIHQFVNIGKHTFINADGGVTIHSGCVLGPHVTIFSVNHIVEDSETLPFANHNSLKPVSIGPNCWIGGFCFICPGVSIGEGSVVAGGSVVTKDVPPCTLVGGNPAKIIKHLSMDNYIERRSRAQYCDWLKNS